MYDFEAQPYESGYSGALFSDDLFTGLNSDPNILPTLSMEPQSPDDAGWSLHGILDAIGRIGRTAQDLGTAVGTVERDFNQAGENFQRARNNAKEGNKLAVWWDYAPTTEKVMVGIGLAGLVLVAVQIIRGK